MKLFRKLFTCIMATLLTVVACFGLTGCAKEDIVQVEIKIQVYNTEDSEFYTEDEVVLTIDLYRHLAPKTCDAIIDYINDGYYNDAIFYRIKDYSNQIFVGEYKQNGDQLDKNTLLPELNASEFTAGGQQGSNLYNKKGSIGLWRSYYASDSDNTFKTSSNAMKSGRGTWFLPTADITRYDGYFCVFAQIDLSNAANAKALSAIENIFINTTSNCEAYEVYYTGEYDAARASEDYGLTFNSLKRDDSFSEDSLPESIFEAEGQQLVSYNRSTVYVAKKTDGGESMAKIKTATIKK